MYRVNAGYVPPDDWVHRQGGRIIGEGCHFIDTLVALTGSRVRRLGVASARSDHANLVDRDSVSITLAIRSAVTSGRSTTSPAAPGWFPRNGSKSTAANAARCWTISGASNSSTAAAGANSARMRQDKGHAEQWKRFIEAVRDGGPPPVPFEDLLHVTRLSILATEAALDDGGWIDIA